MKTVELRGGWLLEISEGPDGADIRVYNPSDNGQKKFFEYSTHGNPYGAGKIIQEPSLGIPLGNIGIDLDDFLVGMLVIDSSGKVVERFSLTNAILMKKQIIHVSSSGELFVNGSTKGFLTILFMPDKNRLSGYVGVFSFKKSGKVKIVEMEDLLFSNFI